MGAFAREIEANQHVEHAVGAANSVYVRELVALRAENDRLTEENRQLRDLFVPQVVFPPDWRFTRRMSDLFSSLLAARDGFRTKEALHVAVGGIEPETDLRLVDVFVCQIRKRLPADVKIETIWGRGFRLPAKSRDRAYAYIAEFIGSTG